MKPSTVLLPVLFLLGVAVGYVAATFVNGERSAEFAACEYDAASLRKAVAERFDVNQLARNDDGDEYIFLLGRIFNPKCLPKGDAFDPDLAYIYLENGGLIEIETLRRFYTESIAGGDTKMIDLIKIY